MSTPVTDELRDLILHRLPESRAAALEERVMTDEDCAAQLQDARYDLLDDYAAGRLSAEDREGVETYLLVDPENRRRLAVARALAQQNVTAVVRRSRWGWAAAAGLLIAACLAAVVIVLVPRVRMGSFSTPSQAFAPLRSSGGAAELGPFSPTLTLLAGAARGGAVKTLRLTVGAREVRVQAEIANPGASEYRLSVLDESGHTLFDADHLRVRSAGPYTYVETDVPTHALAPGVRRIAVAPQSGDAGEMLDWEIHGVIARQ